MEGKVSPWGFAPIFVYVQGNVRRIVAMVVYQFGD